MKLANKVLFYALIFLMASLYPIPLKADLIVHKSEKNDSLHGGQDKFEISLQKIFSEKSSGKDENFKKEDGRNFTEVSKEEGKNEKLTIKDERDKNIPRLLQDIENYIIVYYGSDANYSSGFRPSLPNSIITHIIYRNENFEVNSNLYVYAGENIKVYIASSIPILPSFFESEFEKERNCESIISIDLSHLQNNFINLGSFFNSCNTFNVLNMSGLNLSNVGISENFFNRVSSIKYLDISNVQLSSNMRETIINHFNDDYENDLIVCQSEQIITTEKFEYKCCNYILALEACGSSIHIDIYNDHTIRYNEGMFSRYSDSNHRDSVFYLVTGDSVHLKEDEFEVTSGNKLEIYFPSSVTTLESFFDSNYDYMCENIVSIDFSHFNISGIISLKNIFKGCSSLISVNFNNLKTDSVLNMEGMFRGCSSLSSIDLSGLNTQLVTSMESMFNGCSELTTLIYADLNTDSVTNMASMFEGCSTLESISLTSFNTEKVTTMESMFKGCSELESIVLSGLDISSVTSMKSMFNVCNALISINLENLNTASLTNMESMFSGCSELETLDLSSFNTASVTSMKSMFDGCSSLTSINFQDFITQSVTNMEAMFKGCRELETLDLSIFNIAAVTNMKSMFNGCSNLISIGLSSFKTEKVTTMESMFNGCNALISLNLSHFNTQLVKNMNSMFYGCTNLKMLDISGFDISEITTGTNMLSNLNNIKYISLKDITLPSSEEIKNQVISGLNTANDFIVCQNENILTSNELLFICCDYDSNIDLCKTGNFIKVFYAQEALYGTNFINQKRSGISFINYNGETFAPNKEITINANSEIEIYFNSNDINLNSFFDSNVDSNVEKILSIDLSHLDSSKVTDMSRMFYGCNSLISINLENFVTPLVTDMRYMFYGCNSLQSINLDKFVTEKVNDMNNMFNGCSTLESISLNTFTTPLVTNMDSMFSGCQSLKYLDLSSFDTSLVTNMNSMFYGCQALEYLDISKFNMIMTSTAENMFHNVINLKYINLYHVQNPHESITNDLNSINNLIICQNENTITNEQAQKMCCYYNILDQNCESQNYIIVYFEKEAQYMTDDGFLNEYRNDISFIIYKDHQTKRNPNQQFTVEAKNKIEIYFSSEITSFENFFNSDYDANVKNILYIDFVFSLSSSFTNLKSLFYGCNLLESIDLSNIDTSNVIDMSSIFYGCSSLKSINLSNFVTEKVEDMSNMFNGCRKIKYLNLSNFDTSLVTSMNSMFYGCQALEYLDISNFNLVSITSIEQMFNGIININYINLYNTKDNGHFSESFLNQYNFGNKRFYVCQQYNIIINAMSKNCCEFDNEVLCKDEDNTTDINETKLIEDIYNTIITNIEDTGYKIVKTQTSVFQYSTIEEQLNNKTEEVSSVDLGECEGKLRKQEGLNDTEQFLMLKLDIKNSTSNAVFVQYEVFNPHDYNKVSLEICKNDTIKIQVPKILEETKLSLISHLEEYGYNIFDINDTFYNDICATYTAQNGADMTLKSRKEIIYDSVKDTVLCQDGCEFQSFNTSTSSANCLCQVQTEETVVDSSLLSFDKKQFYDGFYKTLNNSNFRVVKCIKLLFSRKGMKSNYGFYSMIVLIVAFVAFVVIHLIKGHIKIINIIKIIITRKETNEIKDDDDIVNIHVEKMEEKIEDEKKDKKEYEKEEKIEENDEDKKENKKELEASEENKVIARKDLKKNSSKMFSQKKQIDNNDNLQAPNKKRSLNRNMTENKEKIQTNEKIISNQEINLVLNTNDNIIKETNANPENEEKKNENKDENKENQIMGKNQDLNDEELNDLDYEEAIILDKRTYWQLYLSLLKKDQLILFTFFRNDDYNLQQIKIILFIVSFAFFFTINGFFFTDESMNNIYEVNGAFKFIYQIPQILYSSIITTGISIILQKLSISEDQILDMKKEKDLEKSKNIANKIKKNLKLKLIIFIVFSAILMILFSYFISCFCAVYENTQLILIEDTLISFTTSLIYPFGFKLLPGLFRIPALRAKNRNKKCLYKISKLVNLI